MSYPVKERLSYSSYYMLKDQYNATGDGRGGVGTNTNNFP